jgi:small ligand-binding sensory domain FIST
LKCPDYRDAREPNSPDSIRRIKDTLAGVLPLSRILLGVRKFADICSGLAKGGGDYVVRQIDWLCKL